MHLCLTLYCLPFICNYLSRHTYLQVNSSQFYLYGPKSQICLKEQHVLSLDTILRQTDFAFSLNTPFSNCNIHAKHCIGHLPQTSLKCLRVPPPQLSPILSPFHSHSSGPTCVSEIKVRLASQQASRPSDWKHCPQCKWPVERVNGVMPGRREMEGEAAIREKGREG